MGHDVSSWFVDETKRMGSEPIRVFKIGTSDYSDWVTKWPSFKRTAQEIKAVNPRVNLSNVDGDFNHFFENVYTLVQTCTLEVGFSNPNSYHVQLFDYGDFETGDFTGWDSQQFSVIDSTEYHAGNYSAKLQAFGANIYGCYFDYILDLKKMYRHSQWAYVTDVSCGRFDAAVIAIYWTGGYLTQYYVSVTSPNSDWTEYSLTIGPAGSGADYTYPNSAYKARVFAGFWYEPGSNPWGTAYVDDLKFTQNDELITVFTGHLKDVQYSKKECIVLLKDRLWDLTQRKIGESETPVEFTGTIPSEIARTICTCYGEISTSDIDSESFHEWAGILSRDNITCDAYYDGQKVTEALSSLAKITDSAIWIEGNGLIYFKRFSEASSLDMVLSIDNEILDLKIDVQSQRLINKQGVAFNFAPESDYFQSTIYYQDSTSVNTYGLREELIEDDMIWFTNSAHAINLAQRKVAHYKYPPKLFDIEAPLVGIYRQIGETIRVVDSFFSQTSADAWAIKDYEYYMNDDKVKYGVDGAATLKPFTLDVSTLDNTIEVLI